MTHSHDPVLNCLQKEQEMLAIYLINLGFTYTNIYRQSCFVPCGNCKWCEYGEEYSCEKGETEIVDLSVQYLAKQFKYKGVLKLINKK